MIVLAGGQAAPDDDALNESFKEGVFHAQEEAQEALLRCKLAAFARPHAFALAVQGQVDREREGGRKEEGRREQSEREKERAR